MNIITLMILVGFMALVAFIIRNPDKIKIVFALGLFGVIIYGFYKVYQEVKK